MTRKGWVYAALGAVAVWLLFRPKQSVTFTNGQKAVFLLTAPPDMNEIQIGLQLASNGWGPGGIVPGGADNPDANRLRLVPSPINGTEWIVGASRIGGTITLPFPPFQIGTMQVTGVAVATS